MTARSAAGQGVRRPLPTDPLALLRVLPDAARWLYARSPLLDGAAEVRSGGGDAVLVCDDTTAVLVGRADPQLLHSLHGSSSRSLLVQDDAATDAQAVLAGWSLRAFVVHEHLEPYPSAPCPSPGVVVSAPLDAAVLAGLPADLRADHDAAAAAAVRVVDGEPVAVCAVSDLTETLWDVGIDTVATARRQGHASAVFRALAAVMAVQGRQPVWAAYEDYPPSLALAARLGFVPTVRMAELTPPAGAS